MNERILRNAGAHSLAAEGARSLAKLYKDTVPEEAARYLETAEDCERIAKELAEEAWDGSPGSSKGA